MTQIVSLYLAQAKQFMRDRAAVFFVLLLPVAFGVFFGLVFSGDNGFTLQLGVVNEDLGETGDSIVSSLEDTDGADGFHVWTGSRAEMLAALEQGDVHVVMVLPQGLSDSLAAGQSVKVEAYHDPARPTSSGVGLGVLHSLLGDINLALSGSTPKLEVLERTVQSDPLRSIDFYLPGMLGVALLWLGVFGTAQPVVAQREALVYRRIGVTSVSRVSILAAEVSWRVTVGLMQTVTFLVVGYLGFGVGVEAWLPFIGTVLLGTLVFVCLGYVLAGLGRSMESSMAIAQLVNFPMMMLSGSMFSAEMLPAIFQPIVRFLPLTYLSDLLRQTMVGAPAVHPMALDFAVLGGWMVVLMLLAGKLWRWE